MKTERIEPGPGQESVWDYPRPPRLERVRQAVRVEFAGEVILETMDAVRVLETSHPPSYYLPMEELVRGLLVPNADQSFCEWKGRAVYFDVCVRDQVAPRAAWGYPAPATRFGAIAGRVAFYAGMMDACYVDGERVMPQAGGFYGGWITSTVVGPFKGGPGTASW
ncbi:hypothetical protein Pla175_28010 [Pirellulimonas nuda]|uniref:DUF427 domain-containing protein n=1 Tax=Pirellulimonas nuda TaxID=2528009 RepID=A0A518DD51_9BACT|nr:DUF427 domain-containing protein [Pirellulimonas nuda]QDU89411.1 hypothetical protein Pla175_28010 [Pirellulimonas nuda]